MKVELISITNNPMELIFKSYRQCYSKNTYGEIPRRGKEEEELFIKDKIDLGHSSPLEHVSFTFSVEGVSRACLSQLSRHRTSKLSVQSQRYISGNSFERVMPDLEYIPVEDRILVQDVMNDFFEESFELYDWLITNGLKKEDARCVLTNATTCNLIVTFDLRNFRNMLGQRLCFHAQDEIKNMAQKMVLELKPYIPIVDYKVLRCQNGLCSECKKV